jgi:hypothetical protein
MVADTQGRVLAIEEAAAISDGLCIALPARRMNQGGVRAGWPDCKREKFWGGFAGLDACPPF